MANEKAKATIYLDGQQAETALNLLREKAKDLKKQFEEAQKAGDRIKMDKIAGELNKIEAAERSVKKETMDVQKVLQNLNGSSFNDLKKALGQTQKELYRMAKTDPGYAQKLADYQKLKAAMGEHNLLMRGEMSTTGRLVDMAKGLLPAFGWAAIGAGAVMAFNKIKNSTDTLSTQWEIFIGGLNQATNEFWRTLATGDWSNFMGRMKEAIEVGREYAATLDDLEEKSRALRIIEADARAKELDLEIKLRNKTLSNEERRKAGEERIQLEKDLAAKRTALAQEEYENELRRTMQETQLSKEQVETIMRDFDSMDKEKAKKFLEIKSNYDSLIAQSERFKVAQSRAGLTENPYTKQIEQQLQLLNSFPESIRMYAESVKGQGRTTDEQLNKTTDAWVKLKEAQNSAVENIPRVITQINSLLAAEKNKNASSANPADLFAVDAEPEQDFTWIKNMVDAETLAFAEKKRSQDEWTAYLDKKVQEQIDIKKRELEFDKEIAAAQEELKSVRIEAVGQIAGALSDMFEKGSAAQIAFLAIEKAAAIAQIIFQTGIANAKAVAASPLTFGQPWVSINTISAGASIAGIVAQTIKQVSASYSSGGDTGPGGKYEPAGIVHKREYVIPTEGTENPGLRPFIDLMEIARRNGSLARLDLRPVMAATGASRSYASGGYASNSSNQSFNPSIPQFSSITPGQIEKLSQILERLDSKDFSIAVETYERKAERYREITKGGLG